LYFEVKGHRHGNTAHDGANGKTNIKEAAYEIE
jgi:hypothetical protein